MLEVSRLGVAESDEEIELSLELSIGGSYGKCEKAKQVVIEESLSRENENENENENVVRRPGFASSEASVGVEQVEGESTGSVDPSRKREIQALRRLEARRKREEKMRKSTVNFRGINCYNYDKAGLEAQQFQDRALDRKIREDEIFLDYDDKSGRKKETVRITNEAAKGSNFALKIDETAIQNQNHGIMQLRGLVDQQSQCTAAPPLKNGYLHPYGAPSFRKEEEDEMKEKYGFQAVGCGSFRPYLNGNGDVVRQKSGTGFDSGHHSSTSRIVNQNVVSNGCLERSSSAISDYRSTSGRAGGSISDTGSHSSTLQANDRQLSMTATSDALNQAEVVVKVTTTTMRVVPKNMILSKDSECGAAASSSGPEHPTSNPPKQSNENEDDENPSKNQTGQNGGGMPCVSTTGNGPNGKTITGFLYRYTKAEVSIVCVCHGTSFSPAEFVEHAGGTDISNPLRHITMVPSSIR